MVKGNEYNSEDPSAKPAFISLIIVCENEWYFHTLHIFVTTYQFRLLLLY